MTYPGFIYPDWYDRRWGGMRISDKVLKSTLFLGKMVGSRFKPTATAFFVSHKHKEGYFLFLVTCAHAVQGMEVHPRFNLTAGGTDVAKVIPANNWFFHPDATRFVDVAVVPIGFSVTTYDTAHIPLEHFCTPEILEARDVGVGDELFYPSLFAYHAGTGRNLPVMRSGTIAGMPIEPVQTKSGPIQAYLMEGRSISGHSGAPVFINFAVPRTYYADKSITLPHPKDAQAYRLLGLVRGFIRADDVGEYITDDPPEQEDLWVNTGISTIIPAQEIAETILQDDIIALMDEATIAAKARGEEQPASILRSAPKEVGSEPESDNPSHKEDFTSLLGAAARSNKSTS
jgi:hypothetical protein